MDDTEVKDTAMRIGVTANAMHPDPERALFKGKRLLYVEQSMMRWLADAGAIPTMISTPYDAAKSARITRAQLEDFDGLLLHGGADLSPETYNEQPLEPQWGGDLWRDEHELLALRLAIEMRLPVLGICRGAQLINVYFGGSLYQDLTTQHAGSLVHRDWHQYDDLHHDVEFAPEGLLHKLFGVSHGIVNSVHHQGIKELGEHLVVEARCPHDGVVEAIRVTHPKAPWILGVQWHPEFQQACPADHLSSTPLVQHFIERCQEASHERQAR